MMAAQEQYNVPPQAKSPDHYARKVYCPKCRARLMDIHAKDLEYKAMLARMGDRLSFDFSMKCPKCGSIVGISFERTPAVIHFRTAWGPPPDWGLPLPTPYRVVLLEEGVGA